jgi:hypothetical protein
MKVFWGRLTVGMVSVSSLYFFPQVLSAVVFSVYIGSGHKLELGLAYTVMTCFNLLKVMIDLSCLGTDAIPSLLHRAVHRVPHINEENPGLPRVRHCQHNDFKHQRCISQSMKSLGRSWTGGGCENLKWKFPLGS